MSKYIGLEAVKWALEHLKDSCDGLFVDFLILKRDGLAKINPITINTKSTTESADALMGIRTADGGHLDPKHVFFNPFVWQWRHEGYPRSGTYSTLARSDTIRRVVRTEKGIDGLTLTLAPNYLDQAKEDLRRSKGRPLSVPVQAFAIWAQRYREQPDDVTIEKLVQSTVDEYHLDQAEIDTFFVDDEAPASDPFSATPMDKGALIQHLTDIAPLAGRPDSSDEPETPAEDLPENLIEYLRGDLLLPEALLRQLVTLLRAGKHLILTGPPGTGKSTLAARLAEISRRYPVEFDFPASKGQVFTTATADWTTFDTIGGYMPDDEGKLQFHEGLFLRALREDKWLVVDELNRADVDKAFGQLFTVLSGHSVELPFSNGSGQAVGIAFDSDSAESRLSPPTYCVGRDWRIIATMNTFDRNLLFQISSAFVRRFAVVHVGIPTKEELVDWVGGRGLSERELALLTSLLGLLEDVRPLGPAIWEDVASYMTMRTQHSFGASGTEYSAEACFLDALTAYVLPQLDGLNREDLSRIEGSVAALLEGDGEKQRLGRSFKELF